MDGRAVVEPPPTPASVTGDQAIFTSIRSPMGSGYRLIAASGGISPAEKSDILHAAPSHGSLSDESPDASGLASFELASGRRCVFLSANAGVEHSGRGGCRVHTHVLVLDAEALRRFHCDPLALETAASAEISRSWLHKPPTRLNRLTLTPPDDDGQRDQGASASPGPPDASERFARIVPAIFGQRPILVAGVPSPRDTLRWILAATPVAFRERLSLSYGLRYSPARPFQIVFAEAERGKAEEFIRAQNVTVLRWEALPEIEPSPLDPWLAFVRRRYEAGRLGALDWLSRRLTQDRAPGVLAQAAALDEAIDEARQADASLLDDLDRRYAGTTMVGPTCAALLAELREAVRQRREELAGDAGGETEGNGD